MNEYTKRLAPGPGPGPVAAGLGLAPGPGPGPVAAGLGLAPGRYQLPPVEFSHSQTFL